jgi:subtilisin family serine protease
VKRFLRFCLTLLLGSLVVAAGWLGWRGYVRWQFTRPPTVTSKIDRRPPARIHPLRPLEQVPAPSLTATNPYHVDLRGRDVADLDLRPARAALAEVAFDTATHWPPADRLPADFIPPRILELGRNPGLGLRQLHARGITGRGVGIAIIDQVLLVDHPEFADRLRWYEEADDIWWPNAKADMHGAAVASLAVGQSIGVAPGADLYYIATRDGQATPLGLLHRLLRPADRHAAIDFGVLARCVRRVLAINRLLPSERRIRVIAIAIGWRPGLRGFDEITAATAEARDAGLLVVCSSIGAVHDFAFQGLGREPLADPDDFNSYGPGRFWAAQYARHPDSLRHRLLVPMDSRTVAGYTTDGGYAWTRQGGWSWAIPYLAGMYALAAQVKPDVTPDEFWRAALATGRTIPLTHAGATRPFGPILDPAALLQALGGPPAPPASS